MKIRKLSEKKNIVIIQGSPRDKDTCPDMDSKSEKLVNDIIDKYSMFINFDLIDLSVNHNKKSIIQPCKGCVSTAGGMICHWACSCFKKNDSKAPDLMHDQDVYTKLEKADAFIVVSPIHWYSLTSQVKAFFDRLVCANLTLTVEQAVDILGNGNIKDSKLTGEAFVSGEYNDLMKNHLEGKYAAFFIHGDNGGTDYGKDNIPESYDPKKDDIKLNDIVKPYVFQCRYSGIFVPDNLIDSVYVNEDVDYYTANMEDNNILLDKLSKIVENLLDHLDK